MSKSLYFTVIRAISPNDGQLKSYAGPHVPGISVEDAQAYCEHNGLGYCKVLGQLSVEIPLKEDASGLDWDNMIDYEENKLN